MKTNQNHHHVSSGARSKNGVSSSRKRGYLIFTLGGSGGGAGTTFSEYARHEGLRVPYQVVHMDTDLGPSPASDVDCRLMLTDERDGTSIIDAALDCPADFGPIVVRIVQQFRKTLSDPNARGSGSRTLRPLSEISAILNQDTMLSAIRLAMKNLFEAGVDEILVVTVASTGGGAGSGIAIKLAEFLNDPKFKSSLESGYPKNCLSSPIMLWVDPWARIDRLGSKKEVNTGQVVNIKSNMMQVRVEGARASDLGAVQFHMLLGNTNANGVHLRTPRAADHYFGLLLYTFLAGYDAINSQMVDAARPRFQRTGLSDRDDHAEPVESDAENPDEPATHKSMRDEEVE